MHQDPGRTSTGWTTRTYGRPLVALLVITLAGAGFARDLRGNLDWTERRAWTWGVEEYGSLEGGICGDSLLDPGENCDDGNMVDGDGCSSMCGVEPGFSCTLPVPAVLEGDAVQDGSLELGDSNPFWSQTGGAFPPICSAATCGLPFASNGEWYAWFGGLTIPFTQTLQQVVNIPDNSNELTFELWVQKCDSLSDVLEVMLDGNVVFTTDPCTTTGSFETRSVDLQTAPGGPYNDNADHSLLFRFDGFAVSGFNSNFFMDQVAMLFPLDPPIDAIPSMCEQLLDACFFEGFEEGLAGWTRFNTGELDLDWGTTDDGICGSNAIPPVNYTDGVGEAACIDTDQAGLGLVEAYLCTPRLDLLSADEPRVSFLYNFQPFGNPTQTDFFEVWAGVLPPSPDTLFGPAYNLLLRRISAVGLFLGAGASETLGLEAVANRERVWICFGYGGDFDIYGQVDEVQVTAEACEGLALTIGGQCPGRTQIEVTGATPGGRVVILRGTGPGSSQVPGGPCAGAPLSLAAPSLVTAVDADADGRVLLTPNLSLPACGTSMQALDMTTCDTTNLGALP